MSTWGPYMTLVPKVIETFRERCKMKPKKTCRWSRRWETSGLKRWNDKYTVFCLRIVGGPKYKTPRTRGGRVWVKNQSKLPYSKYTLFYLRNSSHIRYSKPFTYVSTLVVALILHSQDSRVFRKHENSQLEKGVESRDLRQKVIIVKLKRS